MFEIAISKKRRGTNRFESFSLSSTQRKTLHPMALLRIEIARVIEPARTAGSKLFWAQTWWLSILCQRQANQKFTLLSLVKTETGHHESNCILRNSSRNNTYKKLFAGYVFRRQPTQLLPTALRTLPCNYELN